MKIGVIGAGGIAGTVVPTIQKAEGLSYYAVASRDLARAQAFAEKHGVEKAYGSYEEMVQDPEVELVYVATPHSHHCEHMLLSLEHGKPVICEKAFTLNAAQAKAVQQKAQEKHLLAAEAIWTRYMPSRKMIRDILDSGIIGEVRMLTANLCYDIDQVERIFRPELAGGALLDVGVYTIHFAMMFFGHDIERIESSVQMTETGVDGMETITLWFRDGRMAALQAGIYGRSDRQGVFFGEKGYIIVENINNPQSVSVYDLSDRLIKRVQVPEQISGYEYQFLECAEKIRAGETETDSIPLEESIRVMEVMDRIRAQWGFRYPMER